MKGSLRKHGKAIGYIVTSDNGAQCVCRGWSDVRNRILLHGDVATIFTTRRQAQQAIRATRLDSQANDRRFDIVRVASLAPAAPKTEKQK